MTEMPTKLDLADVGDALAIVPQAIVVPPLRENRLRHASSGVLDAQGRFVPQSISWTSSTEMVNTPPDLPQGELPFLSGRYLFGGIIYGHFGHFIVESLARLWGQDAVEGKIEGIIFNPKVAGFPESAVPKLETLGKLLGLRLPIYVANDPVRVEELIVPKQGFGMMDLSKGSQAFRDFITAHAGADVAPEGGERLYISRSKLPTMRGSILGESRLEEYLAAEGYDIFHPQSVSPKDQIARYKAARYVVGVDCSPVHVLGYVSPVEQRVAILKRRDMKIGEYLVDQLRSFRGIDAVLIDALVNDWMPNKSNRPSRASFGEVDFGLLQEKLLSGGLIKGTTPWVSLSETERAAELARLEELHSMPFVPNR